MQEPTAALLVIQQALTPVFLIVGIGTMLNALTSRLARVVDRVRSIEHSELNLCENRRFTELSFLAKRMRWANWAINFLCGATILVCINIFLLVVQAYWTNDLSNSIVGSFLATLFLVSSGLICFFVEVSIATRTLRVIKPLTGSEEKED